MKTVQFTPAHDKESTVNNQKTSYCLCVISCEVINCSSAKEMSNKQSVKQEIILINVTLAEEHVTISNRVMHYIH
jgi:hypothetical protein